MSQSMTQRMAELTAMHDPDDLQRRAQKEIDRAQVQLLSGSPFFAVLLMKLRKQVMKYDPEFTMAVDGKHLFWGPAFVLSLSKQELKFVLCHEVLHCALGHMSRRSGRDQKIWNVACDHSVNLLLLDMPDQQWKMPDEGYADDQYSNLPAEVIYDRLTAGSSSSPAASGGAANPGSGDGAQDPSPGSNEDDAAAGGHGCGGCGELLDAPAGDAEAGERVWQQHAQSAMNAALKAGRAPGNLARVITERAQPKLPWRGLLQRYFSERARDDYAFVPPNRRFVHRGIYLPSRHSEKLGSVAVVWDTSGSVSGSLMAHYLAETEALIKACSPTSMVLIACDSKVQEVHHFDTHSQWKVPGKVRGGGGTRFAPPFEYLEREGITPSVLLYFSDLEGRFPHTPPAYDVLWAQVGGRTRKVPFGEVVPMQQQAVAA